MSNSHSGQLQCSLLSHWILALLFGVCCLSVWAVGVFSIWPACREAAEMPNTPAQRRLISLADDFKHLIVHGDIEQLKQELRKPRGNIPHILHRVYIDGNHHNLSHAIKTGAVNDTYLRTCIYQHQHWVHMSWDLPAVEKMLLSEYPHLAEMFYRFHFPVSQSDLGRYMALHRMGGMYLDLDVECFRPTDDMLRGADCVLQGTVAEVANNVAMATHSGVDFWEAMIETIAERSGNETFWDDVLNLTGPRALGDTLCKFLGLRGQEECWDGRVGINYVRGQAIRLWPGRTWFSPCWFNNQPACANAIKQQHASGTLPHNLTGLHLHARSWKGWSEPDEAS